MRYEEYVQRVMEMREARVEFCGVLNGSVILLPGETAEEAVDRAQKIMQRVLDTKCARLMVAVGLERPV